MVCHVWVMTPRVFHTHVAVFLPTAKIPFSLHKAPYSLCYQSSSSDFSPPTFQSRKQLADCCLSTCVILKTKLTQIHFHFSDDHLRCLQTAMMTNFPPAWVITTFLNYLSWFLIWSFWSGGRKVRLKGLKQWLQNLNRTAQKSRTTLSWQIACQQAASSSPLLGVDGMKQSLVTV